MQMWQHKLRHAATYTEKLKPMDGVVSWQRDLMKNLEFWSFGENTFWMALKMHAAGYDSIFPF